MLKSTKFLIVVIIFFLTLGKPSSINAGNYDLTGKWNWTDTTNNGQNYFGTAQINQNGTTLTLTWQWKDQNNSQWSGNGFTSNAVFSLDGTFNNGQLTAHWDGEVLDSGNKLQGTWTQSDRQHGTFVAVRLIEFKPLLIWQRSTEAQNKVVTETSIGSEVNEALQLPLDANQTVFDNGVSTPTVNKNAVASGIFWASWSQYSSPNPTSCGPIFELRHFQAKFNLGNLSNIKKIKLVSPYYSQDIIPINDNLYLYINGNFVTRLGTSYGAVNRGMNGHALVANETDGWVANGVLPTSAIAFLISGQNTLDIVAGETCRWGGMGKLELVLEADLPTPFLDLPWDYQGQGLSFSEAALAINSYFDHEYPMLSSGLAEPVGKQNSVIFFRGGGQNFDLDYSSHDGYDYGKQARANIGDPVLAAAAGCASYKKTAAGGHVILIDHQNGYQTRYLHLQEDGLITKSSSCVQVTKGQQIGKVGATGNVIPPGELGAHIHFMVIQDKNNDGNFDDNIPDGVIDPFGWQSTQADPWPNYSFSYAGQSRTGNTSFYLWTKAIANLSDQLTANGGFFELERYKLNFPQGATVQNLNLEIQAQPIAKPSNFLQSIGSTIKVTTKDLFGNVVDTFQDFFTVTVDFSSSDISSYDPNSIAIYSSEDGINWTEEETTIDEKTASAQVNHLSYFALMAQRLDTIAPTTTTVLTGDQGEANWFRTDVQVTLNAQDNTGGLGVDYTMYKIDGGDWQQYNLPFTLVEEGTHSIEFYSADKDENIESIKNVVFNIDKTVPTATIQANPNILWPPNNKLVNVEVSGSASDNNQIANKIFEVRDEYDQVEPTITDFGTMIQLQASRKGEDKDGRKYEIRILAADLAGNETQTTTEILVPHDQRW